MMDLRSCGLLDDRSFGSNFTMTADASAVTSRMRDHAIKIYPELSEELMPKFQDMPAEEKPAEKAP